MQQKRRRRTKAEIARARAKALSARKHHLRTTHSMTQQEYDDLLAFQGGICLICGKPPAAGKNLHLDHDHSKSVERGGTICHHPHNNSCRNCWRGLVHRHCNDLLSNVRDSEEVLLRAVDFLRNPPAQLWLNGGDHDRTSEA